MATMSFGFDDKISRPVLRMIRRRRRKRVLKHTRRCSYNGGRRKQGRAGAAASSKAVAERLEALRNLIPPRDEGVKEKETAADTLFEETADYIRLLRTQVEVLKRLVDFYTPCMEKNDGGA